MKEKLLWADWLRAVATISVILLHVSAPILGQYGSIPNDSWWIGNIYDGIVRFSVPVFLMLTGALMLSKPYELTDFFSKRFTRIFFPFLFWSIVYIAHDILQKGYNGTEMGIAEIGKYTFLKLKNGASVHLWYIYMLIGIYLMIPIINKWILNSSRKEIMYYLFVWLLVIIISLPVIRILKPNVDVRYFAGYLGYPILGYFLFAKVDVSKSKGIPLVLLIVGILITIVGTYLATAHKGHFYPEFYKYLSPNVIMASIGIFLLFRSFNFKYDSLNKAARFIGTYSYGIYLSHILILFFLSEIGINWKLFNPIIGIPITTVLCLTISLLLIYVLNKIPLGKYVSG